MHKYRFRAWETAALLALCLTLLWGTWAQARQSAIAGGLVRLHVIAASDAEEEQALKLRVRDAVLDELRPRLEGAENADAARAILRDVLPEVEAAAASAARGRQVRVSLGQEDYPARDYGGFTLPAGRYESLRIILGAGEGRNWWCVVFPPLCLETVETVDTERLESVMSPEDYALVTGEEGYELRFWLVDLWGELLRRLR